MSQPLNRVDVAIIVLPLPAQGHLNQCLHLSGLLAARGLEVHYVSSTSHIRQVLDHCDVPKHHNSITYHPFPLPTFASPPPDPHAIVKFPSHLQPSFDAAATHFHGPLSDLLRSLAASNRCVIILHDSMMSFAVATAAPFQNVETFAIHTVSALCLLNHFRQVSHGNGVKNFTQNEQSFPFVHLSNISIKDCFTPEFLTFMSRQHKYAAAGSGRLLNTFPLIEHKFVELLKQEPQWKNQKIFSIGPLNPVCEVSDEKKEGRHECLQWLDKHPPSSVVFVSFGTTSAFSEEQVKELAVGLSNSKHRFLWVLRDADRGDIYAQNGNSGHAKKLLLPLNFEEIGRDVGKVVRGWAPQLEILAHQSTAAFMTHCGWNSCMESISNGVAMLTWPMHSDQPANAVLVTKVLGTGVFAREWGKRNEVLRSESIAEAVDRIMESDEGLEVRRRARVLGDAVREGMKFGGGNKEELDAFVAHVRAFPAAVLQLSAPILLQLQWVMLQPMLQL